MKTLNISALLKMGIDVGQALKINEGIEKGKDVVIELDSQGNYDRIAVMNNYPMRGMTVISTFEYDLFERNNWDYNQAHAVLQLTLQARRTLQECDRFGI